MSKNSTFRRFIGAWIGFILAVRLSIVFAIIISDGGIYLALWVGLLIWGGGPELGAIKLGNARSIARVAFTPIVSFFAPFVFLAVLDSIKASLRYDTYTHIIVLSEWILFLIIGILSNIIARAFVQRDYWLVFRIILLPIEIFWILVKSIFSKDVSSSDKSASSLVATEELVNGIRRAKSKNNMSVNKQRSVAFNI